GFTSKKHAGWTEIPLINWSHLNTLVKQKITKFIITECSVGKTAFALYISDQSMEPLFPEKSIVIVDPESEPTHGSYIIIKTGKNELILRNFLLISGNKYTTPLNPKFGTIAKLLTKDKILGTVVRTIYDHRIT
ncbi:MAG: S24 family peptidase, partial [Gammaproteobacteria bacterium]